ncbi:DNA translocase FtsK [Methylacidiphilum caldifontis]|uniref:FtsK domain-containing protein n=1 Tax=Methylacidiphilum caldifontis TaxID=2795386 RepID=A0A4Y8P936_9BACT|nr:DNA translocase FtsK [Methylacidiphilum caldifontis]TFE67123.1 hypothetical protein A7Q10_09895 [Methylacidiphilum caldifontis]
MNESFSTSLETLFQREKERLLDSSELSQYDPDALSLVTRKFFDGYQNGKIGEGIKDKNLSFCWLKEDHGEKIYFGFVKSSNYRSWGSIAKKALDLQNQQSRYKTCILFRTFPLEKIPKDSWSKSKEIIEQAQKIRSLDIVVLSKEMTSTFYSLNRLYLKAGEGEIPPYTVEDVQKCIKEKLEGFFESILYRNRNAVSGELKVFSVTELINGIIGDGMVEDGTKGKAFKLGKLFHEIVKEFSLKVRENPNRDEEVILRECKKGFQDKIDELVTKEEKLLNSALGSFLQKTKLERKEYSSVNQLFWKVEERFEAYYPSSDSKIGKMKIYGDVDRLSMDGKKQLKLVEYKIGSGDKVLLRYQLQLALYSWLLAQNQLKPQKIELLFFDLDPKLSVTPFSFRELQLLFDEKVKPYLEKLLNKPTPLSPSPSPSPIPSSFEKLKDKLNQFFVNNKIQSEIIEVKEAPQFIRFFISPNPTTKINYIMSREQDIKIILESPGNISIKTDRNYLIIDLPKEKELITKVCWSEVLEYIKKKEEFSQRLFFPIGKTIEVEDQWIFGDFTSSQTPHLLIGGTTGSGKSQFLKTMIATLLLRSPEVRIAVADFKGTDLVFRRSTHVPIKFMNDQQQVLDFLQLMVQEMENRYHTFKKEGIEDLTKRFKKGKKDIPYQLIIFDEYAEMLYRAKKQQREQLEKNILRLVQMGRAAGIHLVISTQDPKKEIVSTLIKCNLPAKICFKVSSISASVVILDQKGAEKLVGTGDLLTNINPNATNELIRAQSPFITQEEWEKLEEEVK